MPSWPRRQWRSLKVPWRHSKAPCTSREPQRCTQWRNEAGKGSPLVRAMYACVRVRVRSTSKRMRLVLNFVFEEGGFGLVVRRRQTPSLELPEFATIYRGGMSRHHQRRTKGVGITVLGRWLCACLRTLGLRGRDCCWVRPVVVFHKVRSFSSVLFRRALLVC